VRTRAGNASLGAEILSEPFLTGIAPGSPFFGAEKGFADHAPNPHHRKR
jgi:hypothetical protein